MYIMDALEENIKELFRETSAEMLEMLLEISAEMLANRPFEAQLRSTFA